MTRQRNPSIKSALRVVFVSAALLSLAVPAAFARGGGGGGGFHGGGFGGFHGGGFHDGGFHGGFYGGRVGYGGYYPYWGECGTYPYDGYGCGYGGY
jgi:hypothetical protein